MGCDGLGGSHKPVLLELVNGCILLHGKDPQLAQWVHTQRAAFSRNKIPEERVILLNAIGFEWTPKNQGWNEMYKRLLLYKNMHNGNVSVPKLYHKDPNVTSLIRRIGMISHCTFLAL